MHEQIWCTHWLEEVPVWVYTFWVCKPVISLDSIVARMMINKTYFSRCSGDKSQSHPINPLLRKSSCNNLYHQELQGCEVRSDQSNTWKFSATFGGFKIQSMGIFLESHCLNENWYGLLLFLIDQLLMRRFHCKGKMCSKLYTFYLVFIMVADYHECPRKQPFSPKWYVFTYRWRSSYTICLFVTMTSSWSSPSNCLSNTNQLICLDNFRKR